MFPQVKVIAGKYRNRILKQPLNHQTRVTKARVKEAVFSSLMHDIVDSTVLDLFSGIGSYGIEASSRGAGKVIFNELNREMYSILEQNTKMINNQYTLFNDDYRVLLGRLSKNSVNLLFLDPPYDFEMLAIVDEVFASGILANNAVIVCETNKKLNFDKIIGKVKYYKYGNTHITIIRR